MAKIFITLSSEDKLAICQLLEKKSINSLVQKRLHVLLLSHKGLETTFIAQQLCLNVTRVRKYLQDYNKQGLIMLVTTKKPGKESLLTEEMFQALESYTLQNKTNKKFGREEMISFITNTYHIDITSEWLGRRINQRRYPIKNDSLKLILKNEE